MIRVGVVCEGPTDFVAIKEFLHHGLRRRGVETQFIALQPAPDRTDHGGWTQVFYWLEQNPPLARIKRFFEGGLLDADLNARSCDIILVHFDTDLLNDEAFRVHMTRMGIDVKEFLDPEHRAREIKRILWLLARLDELTQVDTLRHVLAPAVEASEAWCVAAFARWQFDPEGLQGQALWDKFAEVLCRSEGRPPPASPAGEPDKDVIRRRRYCERHSANDFVEQAYHLRLVADTIAEFAAAR